MYSVVQSKNEKKAQAMPELSYQFHDFFKSKACQEDNARSSSFLAKHIKVEHIQTLLNRISEVK